MPQITAFAPRVYEEVGRFFAEHPVVTGRLTRELDMGSPCVQVGDGRCGACGAVVELGPIFRDALTKGMSALGEELPRGTLPSDALRAIEFTHAWDQASRSVYCGGRIVFGAA